jgi:hypothetical protein
LLCFKAKTLAASSPNSLLQSQFVVLTEAAHLVNHCQGKLTYNQATSGQQIRAFKVGAVEVLNTSVDREAGGQHCHEQHAWSANYGVDKVFHFGIPFTLDAKSGLSL